jgi:transposase
MKRIDDRGGPEDELDLVFVHSGPQPANHVLVNYVTLLNVNLIEARKFYSSSGTAGIEKYRGRKREDVSAFFDLLGEAGCAAIEAVAMDMNAAYEQEVRARCPNAQVVFDLFHVVAKFGREVIDRVRVDEANRLRHDKPARKVIKGSRWLLLRDRSNIQRKEDRVKLDELLKANRRLMTVYVLMADLKHLWSYTYPGAALRFWKQWYSRAIRSRIDPLKRFARNLKRYLPGILAHCRYPLNTSVLEGINNKIKVLKRMAYGFRDDDYFFLKIRQAFPGIGR